jgi:hypothetical protein
MPERSRLSIPLRLTGLPALAAAVVLLLALLTVSDLGRSSRSAGPAIEEEGPSEEDPGDELSVLERRAKRLEVPLSEGVPQLSEEEALEALADRPLTTARMRAAVMRLWPLSAHREKLHALLLEKRTPAEVRLLLLTLFRKVSLPKALDGARAVAREEELPESPLLLGAYEILARHGEARDLELFGPRAGESHQLLTLREGYRDELRRHLE